MAKLENQRPVRRVGLWNRQGRRRAARFFFISLLVLGSCAGSVSAYAQDTVQPVAADRGGTDIGIDPAKLELIRGAAAAADQIRDIDRLADQANARLTAEQREVIGEFRDLAFYRLSEGISDAGQTTGTSFRFPRVEAQRIAGYKRAAFAVSTSTPGDTVKTRIRGPRDTSQLSFIPFREFQAARPAQRVWQAYSFGQSLQMRAYAFKADATTSDPGCIKIIAVWDDPTDKEVRCTGE